MCAVVVDIYRQCTPNVHIACSNKTSRVSKHHLLHFLPEVWRCTSTCHSCLVTQRSGGEMFCVRALRQTKLALRLLYEWRTAEQWAVEQRVDIVAVRHATSRVCTSVLCTHTHTHIHNRSVHSHNTHDALHHLRETPVSMLCIIRQSLLEKAERATSCWLCFDACH